MQQCKDDVSTEELTQMFDAIYKVQGGMSDEVLEPMVVEALPSLSSRLAMMPPSISLKLYRSIASYKEGVLTSKTRHALMEILERRVYEIASEDRLDSNMCLTVLDIAYRLGDKDMEKLASTKF